MKKKYLFSLLLLFISSNLFSQLIENFDDNNFTLNPEWVGNTQYFIVNTDLKLQLNGLDSESDYNLATRSTLIDDTEWRFTIHLDFNPTSSNFIRIYLISNSLDLVTTSSEGYFIQIGETNEDYIRLMRQSARILAPEITEIAAGTTSFSGDVLIKIKVIREVGGIWKIYSAPTDSENYTLETSVTDNTHTSSSYFGLYCAYKTTSRYNQFYFDDIYIGEIIPDTEKPYIQDFKVLTKNKIQVQFSELLTDTSVLSVDNYTLNGTTQAQSADYLLDQKQIVQLNFSDAFAEEITQTLVVENIEDLANNKMDLASYNFIYSPIKFKEVGVNSSNEITLFFTKEINPNYISRTNFFLEGTTNPIHIELLADNKSIKLSFSENFINNTSYFLNLNPITSSSGDIITIPTIHFTYHKPEANDLVINEIMSDPNPAAALPEQEYIEIFNQSDYTICLNNWTLTANTSTKSISHYNLAAGEYLILCDDDDLSEFEVFGNTHALSSFPSLTNSGMLLKLKSSDNTLISRVNYSEEWIESELKRDGGWSIERIDPKNFCGEAENWKESENLQGGTPGKKNSIMAENPDRLSPQFDHLELIDTSSIELFFSEALDFQSTMELSIYEVDNNIQNPIEILIDEDKPYSIVLKFASSFSEGIIYNLTINSSISDCAGNKLAETYHTRFAIPERSENLDIIINEVLFNPFPEGSDFVEIYNKSNKVIDLKSLLLTSRDADGNLKSRTEIKESHLLFPKEYVVITSNKRNILENYTVLNQVALVENDLPSMSDDEGNIVLMNQNLEIIDEFYYTNDMHFALISNEDGISLERITLDGETNDKSNWHSAAQNVGGATPSYQNSAFSETPITEQTFSVTPEVFSPDNDGYDDVVFIAYKLEKAGYVANVQIYNANGILINRIVNNELLGTEGHFKWDGTYNEKQVAKMGIYIIFIELFDLEGNVKKYKKTCVLAKQF